MIVVLATGNPGKAVEYARLLAPMRLGVTPIGRLVPGWSPPEEAGATFEDNALFKARTAAAASGAVAIADDSGLCCAALKGAPGVRSARFGGQGLDDAGRCAALLAALAAAGADDPADRAAWFECVIAVAAPDGRHAFAKGRCDGRILDAPRGARGFGYDPLFLPLGETLTFAEVHAGRKDAIGHRGKAARALPAVLLPLLRP